MSSMLDALTDEQVRRISLLLEALDKSNMDFLRLELDELTLTIGKGDVPAAADAKVPVKPALPPAISPASPASAGLTVAAESLPLAAQEATGSLDDTAPITAPMMGRFYAAPEPGAAPFVSLGGTIRPGDTIGLIEVMKLFTAIEAEVGGTIVEIRVKDGEFIEYGQVLFRVKPQSGGK